MQSCSFARVFVLVLVACGRLLAEQSPVDTYNPDEPAASHASTDLRVGSSDQDSWLFPITHLNPLLPPWISFGGQFRNRVESQDGLNFAPINDVYNLTQLRLGVYLQPFRWIRIVGVAQDARVFFNRHVPTAPSYQNVWDVREAYLQLGSSTDGWLDLTAGCQILSFGDERVIGPSDWSNMGRTFDAIRLDVHQPRFKVSIFASSVIIARDGVVDHHLPGNNFYGFYSSFTHLIPHSTIEPYLLWRIAPGNVELSENAGLGHLNEVTGGTRVAGTLRASFDYDVEMNKQTGSLGMYSIDAWAGHWNAGYTLAKLSVKPHLFAEYNYASGNKNPHSRTWGTHDQIYPSAHDKMDFADQVGWRNIEDLRAGVIEKLRKKWELTEGVDNLWLATKNDSLYDNSGSIAVAPYPAARSRHVGTELELIAEYKQNRHVTYGFGFAHLFVGQFLREASPGKDVNYSFGYVTYIF